jgi:hypothetical protein
MFIKDKIHELIVMRVHCTIVSETLLQNTVYKDVGEKLFIKLF